MTESTAQTFSPRLERPRDSAFKGVCSALARTTGTEPVLWRVLAVILTLFSGLGILLYLIGLVTIPREDEEHSLAHRLIHGPDRRFERNQVLLLVLVLVAGLSYVGDTSHLVVGGVALVLGFLWWRGRGEPAVLPAPQATEPSAAAPVWAPPPPRPARPRSPLGGITVSIAAIVAGVLALIGVTGTDMPAAVPVAAALAVVGVGLVAGSFFGRSWGLFVLAGFLTLALGMAAGVQPLIDDGVGERDWSPTASADYRLGAGKGVLDLRGVRTADITAHVGYGQLLVLVPAGLPVAIDATSDYGDVDLYGKDEGGRHHHEIRNDPDATVHLQLSVRAGQIKVVHP
jgi:phage shock protein PspC (stress-responsive transcriptional regulator)